MPLDQPEEKEMSFLDHLEELRWHLLRAVSSIAVFTIIAFSAKEFVIGELILGPSRVSFPTYQFFCWVSELTCIDKLPFTIQSRTMTGQFTMHLTSSAIIGLICAFPYTFWEIWRFVKPALHRTEQKVTRGATFVVSLLFGMGIVFGYYLVAPLSINFLSNYQIDPSIINEIDIVSYVSTLSLLVLACGLMFQLPVAVYFMTEIGFLTPTMMRTYRRHAIVVILFISAIITPPDVMSQLLVSAPILVLYEMSIWVSAWVLRQAEKTAIN